jgi:hypothetical protein
LANEPLFTIPAGMHVAGSKPWFCKKKITRFGADFAALAPKETRGRKAEPMATPAPAAIPLIMLLRLVIMLKSMG